MKLTNYDKDVMISAIKRDLPEVDDSTAIQAALEKAMSPLCRKLYKLTPGALNTQHAYSNHFFQGGSSRTYYVGDADFDAVTKPFRDKCKQREATMSKVSAAIHACTTLKQLQERLPEFVRYAPQELTKITNALVVQNPAAELKALGWPVGVKK
jgi:hypothetical protein